MEPKKEQQQKREHVYLAALLHDIGKFYQRADTGSVKTSIYLNEINKVESTFLPQKDGFYTHKHCLWTAQFIDDFNSVFSNLIQKSEKTTEDVRENLINLSAGHHLPFFQQSELGKIIKEADHLSSGMDRDNQESFKDDQDEQSWDSFKKKRMVSILETINHRYKDNSIDNQLIKFHQPVEPMRLDESYFPKSSFQSDPDYATLWEKFINEFKFIQADSYKAFSETLVNLLFKYTSCIPASTVNFPDVSLFDHLKTTAAISVCLYDFYSSNEEVQNQFLLVGGDLSGIQSYIKQIASKYASKNLKGRSFYIKLLSDSVTKFLLKEMNLFSANVIYNSGGSFYILAPNTTHVKNQLANAIKKVEKHIFDEHGLSLYIAIDSVSFSKDVLIRKAEKTLNDVWTDLFQKRDKKKHSKIEELLVSNYSDFFEPIVNQADCKKDSITGEIISKSEKFKKIEDLILKENTFLQIQIGDKLKSTKFIVVSDEIIPYWNELVSINPVKLGIYYYLLTEKEFDSHKEKLKASADKVNVITLNGENGNCDFLKSIDGINNIYSLDFYGGNEYDNNTFESMSENENFSRLGVLKMDVDNLGSIFQDGIDPNRSTLSRYAALSRSFDYFFSGFMNSIWKKVNPNRSLIIYSGGDDLFIVGSWDVCIQLAESVRDYFKKFTCENPAFSVSCGISIITPKYPIIKGSDESQEEEMLAKGHSVKINNNTLLKDSISFMETPMKWNTEYIFVKELKQSIKESIQQHNLPKSYISKILMHFANANMNNHTIQNIRMYWLLNYDLSRMIERNTNENVKNLIDKTKKEICNGFQNLITIYHPIELYAIACRWAELELRTNNNTK